MTQCDSVMYVDIREVNLCDVPCDVFNVRIQLGYRSYRKSQILIMRSLQCVNYVILLK